MVRGKGAGPLIRAREAGRRRARRCVRRHCPRCGAGGGGQWPCPWRSRSSRGWGNAVRWPGNIVDSGAAPPQTTGRPWGGGWSSTGTGTATRGCRTRRRRNGEQLWPSLGRRLEGQRAVHIRRGAPATNPADAEGWPVAAPCRARRSGGRWRPVEVDLRIGRPSGGTEGASDGGDFERPAPRS